jgi:hypothetical protein
MADTPESEILLSHIRDAIMARLDESLTIEETREAYKNMLIEYSRLEKKFVSEDASGYLKGLLYNHNKINYANLTAVFMIRNDNPAILGFYGDAVLLKALPELIMREYDALTGEAAVRLPLTKPDESSGYEVSLIIKKIIARSETFLLASITSARDFNIENFNYLSELVALLFSRGNTPNSPAVLDYIKDISSEISMIIQSSGGTRFYIDYYMLLNPYEAFSHIGIYPMIEFSDFIMEVLKKAYSKEVRIFALTVFKYLVLYDEEIKKSLDIKRNRIDIIYQGNSIPYKVLHEEIATPQSLYPFLEKL